MELPFITERTNEILQKEFEHPPIVFTSHTTEACGSGGKMFVAGKGNALEIALGDDSRLRDLVVSNSHEHIKRPKHITTDDWPYLYLPEKRVPIVYLLFGCAIFLVFLFRVRGLTGILPHRWTALSVLFFSLGAAFLLLEVQSINRAALALGNTWLVSAVVVSGILSTILVSNCLAYRFRQLSAWHAYPFLIASCLALYFIDFGSLNSLSFKARVLAVAAICGLPVLFSEIVFVRAFENAREKDSALGANLFGSLVGGALQCLSMIFGLQSLVLIAGVFYLASAFAYRTERQA